MPEYITGAPEVQVPPEGDYDFGVDDAGEKESQKGNAMIELQLAITYNGTTVRVVDYLVFTQKAFWKIDHFRASTGEKLVEGEKVNLEAEDCIDRRGRCRLIVETYEGKSRNKVDDYLPPASPPESTKNEFGEPDNIPF